MADWQTLGLSEALTLALKKQGIEKPTQIQERVFPLFLEKKDIVAQSETGSGKTLAFLLPLIMQLDYEKRSAQAIILAPTHELAAQIHKQIALLAENSGLPIRSALLIGGANRNRQLEKLKEKPQIVVGSSGRILDMIQSKKLSVHFVKTIAVDEADRMTDRWNSQEMQAVIKTTLRERQLVFFTASVGKETKKAAEELMKVPIFLLTETPELPKTLRHSYILCEKREKIELIRKIYFAEKPEKTIVFLNNPENIEVTVEKLCFHGVKAAAIYGGVYRMDRRNVLNDFREGRIDILVASDLGARGLDIPEVTHIINLDIPEDPIFYLHRAGRAGRMQKQGVVISLTTPYERRWILKYQKELHILVTEQELSFGKLMEAGRKGKKNKEPRKQRMPKEQVRSNKEISHFSVKSRKTAQKRKKS